jgi:hypothetical protein
MIAKNRTLAVAPMKIPVGVRKNEPRSVSPWLPDSSPRAPRKGESPKMAK